MVDALPLVEVSLDKVKLNLFSKHDNRLTLECYGDHLGGPYGRRHTDPSRNQHYTGNTNIKWINVKPQYKSTYASGYTRQSRGSISSATSDDSSLSSLKSETKPIPVADQSILDRFYPVPTKEHFNRFPKRHKLPKDKDFAKPSVNTLWWSIESSKLPPPKPKHHLPSMSVLGASQLPYLKKNTWKYSYKP